MLCAIGCVGALLVWVFLFAPKHPVALIRVVDAAGKPIAGAVVKPDGLRTKPGPYASGHYGWAGAAKGLPNESAVTDERGVARVSYPRYVFERIETGQISFLVSHSEFVADRPFRTVTTKPPLGASWREWVDYVWSRIQKKALIARVDPVVLQKGSILKLSVRPDSPGPKESSLFAQVSGDWTAGTNFWVRPEPGVIVTRRMASGSQTIRALRFETNGAAWFGAVTNITVTAGLTNEAVVELQRGVAVRGQLEASVPRPVKDGRVIAHVWPPGLRPQDSPPQWHAWTRIREDGNFEISSLPQGELEIVALCHGYVSTNGPGRSNLRRPQKHRLGTNDIAITMGMERTARLEVQVTDDQGHPVKDAQVSAWPNVRYGEWSATILASDCYNTSDSFLSNGATPLVFGMRSVPDFAGASDSSGLAVIPNLPADVKSFGVSHPRFALPAVQTPGLGKHRVASVTLVPGQTNRVSVRLEPSSQSPISHY